MSDQTLLALSPLDGRYAGKVAALRPIFSEFGLIKGRVRVEVEWLLALADEPGIVELAALPDAAVARLRALADNFNTSDAARQLIMALLPGGRCTADQVAQHLGMDRRTLHRHLQTQATSFTALMQLVRSEFIVRQIRDSDRSMAELAELLGFSGSSAFAYWFRVHFGCTVSQWRSAHAQQA